MLQHLHIKNLILIKDLSIDFSSNLNIITGETGAGKSMLTNSLDILFGKKKAEDKTTIEAVFNIKNLTEIKTILDELSIDYENDEVIIRKAAINSRSRAYINGIIVTNAVLKQLGTYLIDLHGQHQHQSLLNAKKHIEFLDRFAGIKDDIAQYQESYKKYNSLFEEKTKILKEFEENKNNIEFLEYQKKELEQINLNEEKISELYTKRNKLKNYTEFAELLSCSIEKLNNIPDISPEVKKLAGLDKDFLPYETEVQDIISKIDDLKDMLISKNTFEDASPEALDKLESDLFKIEEIKRKYKKDINELNIFYSQINEKLEKIESIDFDIKSMDEKLKQEYTIMNDYAKALSDKRKKHAKILNKKIETELKELGMKDAVFDIKIKASDFTLTGCDNVDFFISANKGIALAPLAQAASGGEISRIMLALKTEFAQADTIPTLIFDEIDTGIGGRTANIVGEKLKNLGKHKQILCITHLPQVASRADTHYLINKKESEVQIEKLSEEKCRIELTRMLGGEKLLQGLTHSSLS